MSKIRIETEEPLSQARSGPLGDKLHEGLAQEAAARSGERSVTAECFHCGRPCSGDVTETVVIYDDQTAEQAVCDPTPKGAAGCLCPACDQNEDDCRCETDPDHRPPQVDPYGYETSGR